MSELGDGEVTVERRDTNGARPKLWRKVDAELSGGNEERRFKEPVEHITDLYRNMFSLKAIAEMYGVSTTPIMRALHRNGLGPGIKKQNQFWSKVEKTDGCWIWRSYRDPKGYGRFMAKSGSRLAHRRSWEMENGPVPDGMCVCHHCDNPPCVRLDHLFLGTVKDNVDDMMAKGRYVTRKGEKHGMAVLNSENVSAIRGMYASGSASQRGLAKTFGVAKTTIARVIHRYSWRDEP